jgi:hypothetical protein
MKPVSSLSSSLESAPDKSSPELPLDLVSACASVHVAMLTQHSTRIHHIVTSFVNHLAPQHFSTLSHKWRNFWETVVQRKMRVLIFSATFV